MDYVWFAKRYGYGGWVQLQQCGNGKGQMMQDGRLFRAIEQNCWDPAVRIREMDTMGKFV